MLRRGPEYRLTYRGTLERLRLIISHQIIRRFDHIMVISYFKEAIYEHEDPELRENLSIYF